MQTKIATVAFTVQQVPQPPASHPAGYMSWLTKDNVTVAMVNISETSRHCTFVIEEPGTYIARVVRMDADGGSIGNSAESDPFVVTEDMMDVPFAVTVSLAPAVATPKSLTVGVG